MKILYGPQTKQAIKNFPLPNTRVKMELIRGIIEIKLAATKANMIIGKLRKVKAKAIIEACKEILKGKYDDQFVTLSMQGGAGTSINMNVNEVIASLAKVHPNDEVNMSQSTNDVNPSGLKIACLRLVGDLLIKIDNLETTFRKKIKQYGHVRKLARTHLQDAVPTSIGEEFGSYLATLERDKNRITEVLKYLKELNLGGTAVGNKINVSDKYFVQVYKELNKITGIKFKPAINLMSQTSSQSDFCHLSSLVNILMNDLSKLAIDLRVLSSGPRGGIGEINLPALQPGSSIMPGKVNPVIPECVSQVADKVAGYNLMVHKGAEKANLELGIMFPLVADSIIKILKLASAAVKMLDEKCIQGLEVNKDRCEELLEKSTAYATLLTPRLGYDVVSQVVKEAIESNSSIRKVIMSKKILSKKEFNKIIQGDNNV